MYKYQWLRGVSPPKPLTLIPGSAMTSYPTARLNSVQRFEATFRSRNASRHSEQDVSLDLSRLNGSYDDYLRSAYWKAVRNKVMIRDRSTCSICGSQEGVEVHHLHYESVRNELQDLESVTTLCRGCHAAEHNLETEEKTGIPGSRDRVVYLLTQWGKFKTHHVSVSKLPPSDPLELASKWYQVQIDQQSFRVNPSDPFSVDQLWPYVAQMIQNQKNFNLINLKMTRSDKVFYEINGARVGRSMTEAILFWSNTQYLDHEKWKAECAAKREQEQIDLLQAKIDKRNEAIAEAERIRASILFIDEIGTYEWDRTIKSFLSDSPKTNPELRALWFKLKNIPEDYNKLPYTIPFNDALGRGAWRGIWRRVKQGLYCSVNYRP